MINQLGYTVDVLQDALSYGEHAGKNDVDVDDIKLAIHGRINHSFTFPPRQEVYFCFIFVVVVTMLCDYYY